jgi:hypothetical protein
MSFYHYIASHAQLSEYSYYGTEQRRDSCHA